MNNQQNWGPNNMQGYNGNNQNPYQSVKKDNKLVILLLIAFAVIIILLLAILLVVSKSKKNEPDSTVNPFVNNTTEDIVTTEDLSFAEQIQEQAEEEERIALIKAFFVAYNEDDTETIPTLFTDYFKSSKENSAYWVNYIIAYQTHDDWIKGTLSIDDMIITKNFNLSSEAHKDEVNSISANKKVLDTYYYYVECSCRIIDTNGYIVDTNPHFEVVIVKTDDNKTKIYSVFDSE